MNRQTSATLAKPVDKTDHIRGPDTAPVTLVEYADFQCEDSGAAYSIVKRLRKEMGDRLRFVFRHFPLTRIHEHAEHAAEAAESASEQGKFWQMHDLLFEHQDELDDTALMDAAEEFGLYVDEFDQDLVDETHRDRIQDDIRSGMQSGVRETPAFFINGAKYEGPIEYEAMRKAIEEAVDKSS